MANLTRFHFSLGNSDSGPIGYCAAVYATSPEQAVSLLRERFDGVTDVPVLDDGEHEHEAGVAYVEAYINPDHITKSCIDFADEPEPVA